MSIMNQLKQMEQERQKLIDKAKSEAMSTIEKALADLRELGFHYKLVQTGTDAGTPSKNRRTGVRSEVLRAVKKHPNGISRSDVLDTFAAKGNKKAEQSISNALANLKKSNQITLADGLYKPT